MTKDESFDEMLTVLRVTRALISEAAMAGFNWKDGGWAERLFANQAAITRAMQNAERMPL